MAMAGSSPKMASTSHQQGATCSDPKWFVASESLDLGPVFRCPVTVGTLMSMFGGVG